MEHLLIIGLSIIVLLLAHRAYHKCKECNSTNEPFEITRQFYGLQGQGHRCAQTTDCQNGLSCQDGYCQTRL